MDRTGSKEQLEQFFSLFGKSEEPIRKFQAPARINIIGEHVDYLGGIVLPAAIDFYVSCWIRANSTNSIRLHSLTYRNTVELQRPLIANSTAPWSDYIAGVISELEALGFLIPGFDMMLDGNIPQGAGLSSSAALEVVVAYALSETFQFSLPKEKIAQIGQAAENNFVGTKCGIMDQFIISVGRKNDCISLNTETLNYTYHHFDLADQEFYLINSNVKHNLKDSAYNQRREECESAFRKIKKSRSTIQNLYDALETDLDSLQLHLTREERSRTSHVIGEKKRTEEVIRGLESGNYELVGKALYEAHWSLSKQFEVSCEETDFLVTALQELGVTGARMIGGGFGGCVLVLDKKKNFSYVESKLQKSYQQKFGVPLNFYKFHIADGVREVNL